MILAFSFERESDVDKHVAVSRFTTGGQGCLADIILDPVPQLAVRASHWFSSCSLDDCCLVTVVTTTTNAWRPFLK